MTHLTVRDSQKAFTNALESGALSDDESSPVYAGRYMYMHSEATSEGWRASVDAFKHIGTRQYLRVPIAR